MCDEGIPLSFYKNLNMKKKEDGPLKFTSLLEAHRAFGLPAPRHPLISLINNMSSIAEGSQSNGSHVLNFYKISYKPKRKGRLRYGQGYYDFDEGGLLFAAPNQIIGGRDTEADVNEACSLYTLLIHPDFLLNHSLAKKIKQYGFFSYSANEALHLSEEEKRIIISIFEMMESELNSRIDDFSQDVVISQLELLLNYANRFYKRQFITRKAASHDILLKLEDILTKHFDNEQVSGIPTVKHLADELNISPSYLSDMLRVLTGKNAQQHIHDKLIEKGKEMLSTTSLSVGEVAYALGFEHSQSFSKFFKTKTKLSPLEFRHSFN
jgi:AraC family transcriptional regulator, transcriptional activator of pobA